MNRPVESRAAAAPENVKRRLVGIQPGYRIIAPREDSAEHDPEALAVVQDFGMHQFVQRYVVAHVFGRENKLPIQGDIALC